MINAINHCPLGDGKRQGTEEESEEVNLLALYLHIFASY
jgi:hypothetical protein